MSKKSKKKKTDPPNDEAMSIIGFQMDDIPEEQADDTDGWDVSHVEMAEIQVQAEDHNEKPKEHKKLWEIELPTGLQERYTKNLVIALLFAIVTIVLLIRFWTVQCCIGFAVSGFLLYKAIELKLDYADGKIKEKAVICASVRYNALSHMVHVTFREDSNNEEISIRYYTFNIPERASIFTRSTDVYTSSDFEINHVYVIYFKDANDSNLLGYVEL